MIAVVSMIIANVGLTQLLTISIPVLVAIYPVAVALVIVTYLERWFKNPAVITSYSIHYTKLYENAWHMSCGCSTCPWLRQAGSVAYGSNPQMSASGTYRLPRRAGSSEASSTGFDTTVAPFGEWDIDLPLLHPVEPANGGQMRFLRQLTRCERRSNGGRPEAVITSYSIHYTKLYEQREQNHPRD